VWHLGGDSDRSARTRALDLIAGVVAAVAVGVDIGDAGYATAAPLRPIAEQADRIGAARASAAADGVFVPGVVDTATIIALVAGVAPAPLSVLAGPDALDFAELGGLGVRRISVLRAGKVTGPVQHC
jgi:2-methylisocitrate lyase-like PEP mutase family enzyme